MVCFVLVQVAPGTSAFICSCMYDWLCWWATWRSVHGTSSLIRVRYTRDILWMTPQSWIPTFFLWVKAAAVVVEVVGFWHQSIRIISLCFSKLHAVHLTYKNISYMYVVVSYQGVHPLAVPSHLRSRLIYIIHRLLGHSRSGRRASARRDKAPVVVLDRFSFARLFPVLC